MVEKAWTALMTVPAGKGWAPGICKQGKQDKQQPGEGDIPGRRSINGLQTWPAADCKLVHRFLSLRVECGTTLILHHCSCKTVQLLLRLSLTPAGLLHTSCHLFAELRMKAQHTEFCPVGIWAAAGAAKPAAATTAMITAWNILAILSTAM